MILAFICSIDSFIIGSWTVIPMENLGTDASCANVGLNHVKFLKHFDWKFCNADIVTRVLHYALFVAVCWKTGCT